MTIKNDLATTAHEQFTPKPTHVCRVCGAPARVIDYRPGPSVELKLRCEAGHYTETGAEPDLRARVLDALDLLDRVRFMSGNTYLRGAAGDEAIRTKCEERPRTADELAAVCGVTLVDVARLVRDGVIVPEVNP